MDDANITAWIQKYSYALHELRCAGNPQHRLQAAEHLLLDENNPDRIAYLLNAVLYDPDAEVRAKVKALLSQYYAGDLENMLRVEGSDGVPIEDPWLTPCLLSQIVGEKAEVVGTPTEVRDWRIPQDLQQIYNALRDPMDVETRVQAAAALAESRNALSYEMLAKAILLDPDEEVQEQAYQALYEAAGVEEAEALLNRLGAETLRSDEEWLLIPPDEDEIAQRNGHHKEESPFGIDKIYHLRGFHNLFEAEKNPAKRIAILKAIARSDYASVHNAIARIGLIDHDPSVKEFTKNLLKERLGDNYDDFIQHVFESTPDLLAEDIEVEDDFIDETTDDFRRQMEQQNPVISEGSTINPILIILLVLVTLGLVLYFLLR